MSTKPRDDSFAKALNAAMAKQGLSANSLSMRSGCSTSHLLYVLRGNRMPGRSLLRAIEHELPELRSHPAYARIYAYANPSDTHHMFHDKKVLAAFGELLERSLEKHKVSTAQMARLVGCHHSHIRHIRQGKSAPGRLLMDRISDALPGIGKEQAFKDLYGESRINSPIAPQREAVRKRSEAAMALIRDVEKLAQHLQSLRDLTATLERLVRKLDDIAQRDIP